MSSSIKLKNANGKTVSVTNSNANQTDKEVIYLNTVDELANASGSINAVAIVSDLIRGGTFEWSATGTANGGTVFSGVSGYWHRQYNGAVNVKWFGAKGDGVTDDTISVRNAKNEAVEKEIKLYFPFGTYTTSESLLFNGDNSGLYGDGMSIRHDGGGTNKTTVIKAITGLTGSVVDFSSPNDALERKRIGNTIYDVTIDCSGIASEGFRVFSQNYTKAERVTVLNPTSDGVHFGCVDNLAEAGDPQDNYMNQVRVEASEISASENANCFTFDGTTGANTSLNSFGDLRAIHRNGIGFNFLNCDNNTFTSVKVTTRPGGTGVPVQFKGGATEQARSNIIQKYSGGKILCKDGSYDNAVFGIDQENGSPWPTLESNSSCYASKTNGIQSYFKGINKTLIAADVTSLLNLISADKKHPLQVASSGENHILIHTPTSSWGIAGINSSGDLRISLLSGTGQLVLPFGATRIGTKLLEYGENDSAGPGYKTVRVLN